MVVSDLNPRSRQRCRWILVSQWLHRDLSPRHLTTPQRENQAGSTVAVPTTGAKASPSHRPSRPSLQSHPPPSPTHTPAARLLSGYHQSASRAALAESGRQPLSARARGGASPAPSQDARRPAAGEVGAERGAQEARGAGEERAPASAPPPSGGAGAVAPAEDRRGQGRDREEGHRGKRER